MRPLRILSFLLLFCMACHSGRIPCPKPGGKKTSRHAPRRINSYSVILKDQTTAEQTASRPAKVSRERVVHNITEEEWDCPEPGKKKYMPRRIKDNIRRNYARMTDGQQASARDSVGVR